MNRKTTTERRIGCLRLKPVELEKCGTKTSRGPKHFHLHRPPKRNETDITQIKKIRQCKFPKANLQEICPDDYAFKNTFGETIALP
jgi:hypothetical protein